MPNAPVHPNNPIFRLKKILVVRNDKLGDFMLAYPSFAMLKENLPSMHVTALVPRYTADMAKCCPWIDEVLIDPISEAEKGGIWALTTLFKQKKFDAIIVLFSTTRVGLAAWLAGVPYRLAPATKVAQVLFNRTVVQRRSESIQPEHTYNSDLIKHFLRERGVPEKATIQAPFLKFDAQEVQRLHRAFCAHYQLSTQDKLVYIHTGSGGSARNVSSEQFAQLARALRSQQPFTLVLTAGPNEILAANELAQRLKGGAQKVIVYPSQQGLRAFAQHIQFASVFIGGSTGPLHIAGALDVPTAGFYPRSRVNSSLRWQTLNSPERRLAFSPDENADEDDMRTIDMQKAAERISTQFLGGKA